MIAYKFYSLFFLLTFRKNGIKNLNFSLFRVMRAKNKTYNPIANNVHYSSAAGELTLHKLA